MSPTNNTEVRRQIKFAAIGALVLIALITVFSSVRSIDTGKIGVVSSYGKVTGRELSEGMATVLPWGINSVTEYDIKTQKVEANSAASTKDLQDVNAVIVLTYSLNRGKVSEVHQNVGKDFQAIEIDPQIQEAFKATTAQYTNQQLVTERPAVKEAVLKTLKDRLQANGRYTVHDIAITDFKFSAAFNAAIEAVQVANQNIAKARQELETTKVEAEKQVAEAQAQAESQRLRQQTLTPEILQQQAIAKWNGVLPVYATDGAAFFNIPTGR